jgi:transcriptional regulator GlxA family with amidase domain
VGGLINEIPNLPRQSIRFLQAAAQARVPLAGVCTGAFILHRAGLMDGYCCCVSWFHHADFLEQFDGLTPVSDQIFVIDRDRLTCSGGTSSAHLAAHLVEKHVGVSAARKSLQIMMIDEALHGDEHSQRSPWASRPQTPPSRRRCCI